MTTSTKPGRAEFRIQGMDCAEEVTILRRELGHLKGIQDLSFDVLKAKMSVDYDRSHLDEAQIAKAVARTGMRAEQFREAKDQDGRPWYHRHGRGILTAVSALFAILGAVIHAETFADFVRSLAAHDHEGNMPVGSIICFAVAIAAGMFYAAPKAWHSLRSFTLDMNALVAVSIFGAVVLQEWSEGATLSFLFSLAGLLESWSMTRARNAVSALLQVAPSEATVVHHDHEHRMTVDKVGVGEVVRIRPGERIPCDGVVKLGSSHVNQALITGESIPVMKEAGSTVFSGTLNGDGLLEVSVSKKSSDSLLSRMLRMLDGAQHRRAPSEQFVERFSRIYTPAMFLLAALWASFHVLFRGANLVDSVYQGMVILLISCPCALVISTPVTVVAALASAAREGVLVKGGAFLEEAAKLQAIAFDKTGVLTSGRPEVQSFQTLDGLQHEDALQRLLALEQRSEHPVGNAIVRYARSQGVSPTQISEFHAIQGRGAEGVVAEERFWAGNHRLLHEKKLERPEICSKVEALEDAGHTAFLCGTSSDVWAVVSLADPVRAEAKPALDALRKLGIEHIVMLTGDNKPTANAVGQSLGITDVRSEMLPEEKARAIQELRQRHQHVAMVGDGINDAQALASATIGIALGRRSTDVALETADVVLMHDDLNKLGFLLRHARRAAAVIKQNVAVALGLKVIFLLMAFAGFATLWMAIAADMGGTLLVTFNGLRLLRATR